MSDEDKSPKGDDDWGAALYEQASAKDAAKNTPEAPTAAPESGSVESAAGDAEPAALEDFDENGAKLPTIGESEQNMDLLLDVPVTISMQIGNTKIPIRTLLQLSQGSVVELDRLAGEPLDVLVNGTLIAHGEVVVVNEKFGIRLTDVISPAERVRKLR